MALVIAMNRYNKLVMKLDLSKINKLEELEEAEIQIILKPHVFDKISSVGTVIIAPDFIRISRGKRNTSSGD